MSRLLLICITGSAVAIMWSISALANFVHGYTKGGGGDPFEMLAHVIARDFASINYMALLFGSGSIASDMIKASALILAGMAVGYRRWGVVALSLCLWLPAQIYSAYSVTGFVSQVMGDAIAKRERGATQARLAESAAATDVERLTWLSKQNVTGAGPSARRAREQFKTQYAEQRKLVQGSIDTLYATPVAVAADPAATLWQRVFRSWTVEDVSTASMLGLGLVIELVAGIGFFLLSKAATMHKVPETPEVLGTKVPEIHTEEDSDPPPSDRAPSEPFAEAFAKVFARQEERSNVVSIAPAPRHIADFKDHIQAEVNAGRMTSRLLQNDVMSIYRQYCRRHAVRIPVRQQTRLREYLLELGIETSRGGESGRRIVYEIRKAA